MTTEIGLVLGILLTAFVLLVSERIRMDVVALLVLGSLALTGVLAPAQALSGFSSPAVVTVWAMFILSGGLARTGIATFVGRQILRVAGDGEARLIAVIMLTAGAMSSVLNNVGVAALLLPVVMDLARRTGHPPSRLLMPLAFGSLLGGVTTLIGTPPNILVNDVMSDFDLERFGFFDYTPVGTVMLLAGTVFMVVLGRHFLPKRDITKESARPDLGGLFGYQERIAVLVVPAGSPLAGRSLSDSRLGAALGLSVLAILRAQERKLAPGPNAQLLAGDRLVVEGRLDRLEELQAQENLQLEERQVELTDLLASGAELAELRIAAQSSLVGRTLAQIGFRNQFGVNILAIRHDGQLRRSGLQDRPLQARDSILVFATGTQLEFMAQATDFEAITRLTAAQVEAQYQLRESLLSLRIPAASSLAGRSLAESRLGDAFGFSVLGINRDGSTQLAPHPDERLQAGDELLCEGRPADLETLRGLRELVIDRNAAVDLTQLESETVGLSGVVLSPQSSLDGKTLRQLNFREKYGLSVIAIWHAGKPARTNLRDVPLRFGDALLLYGARPKLRVLANEPDFLVLTEATQAPPRLARAPIALLVMVGVLAPVILGWIPMAIAAVVGASAMVVLGCLTMEEAYRDIEWRAVFLIAGMLPLGIALQQTGAAAYLAEGLLGVMGVPRPLVTVAGTFVFTAAITQVMPTPAVIVLVGPIAITTAGILGLSPYALAMTVAVAAAGTSLNPVAHPANSLVMGPGGYRFSDFLKVGIPLTVVLLVVVLIVLPVFWPL